MIRTSIVILLLAASFDWFAPWIEIGPADRRDLRRHRSIARTLPAGGNEIALFFAGALQVDPAGFVDAVRRPEILWTSARVPDVVRFSMPPRLEDVARMQLEPGDVEAVRRCRPGDCAVKLSATEIQRLQAAASIQQEFRRIVLDRVRSYLNEGFRATDDFRDREQPVDLQTVASHLLLRSPWLTERAPALAEHMERYPAGSGNGVESFLYWLKTTLTPKPTIQVIHVMIASRDTGGAAGPEVLVVSRQVYASHYINGTLAVSALFREPRGPQRYLAYVIRAHVDGLSGWFTGIRRLLIERRSRSSGREAFEQQLRRLERGS